MTPRKPRTGDLYLYFVKAYRSRTALMILFMLVAGIAEGFGVIALIPVLDLADPGQSPTEGAGATVSRIVQAVGLQPTLPILLAFIVIAMTVKATLLLFAQRQVGFTVAGVVRDLRLQVMRGLLRAKWSYFAQRGPGQFANSVSSETSRAAAAYAGSCSMTASFLQMLAYFVVATLINWWVAAGALLVGSLLSLIARHFFKRSREAGSDQTSSFRNLSARLVDALQGIKPLKAMGREGLVWPLLEHEAQILNQAKRKEIMAGETLKAFQEPILTVIMAIGLWFALAVSGQPLSSMMVLAFIFYRMATNVNSLQRQYQYILVGESAFFSLRAEMDEAERQEELWDGRRPFKGLREGIDLEGLSFRYGDTEVLHEVSAHVPAGAFVAIHGESGSGKTTLADLIVGLHVATEGRILIDGRPLPEWDLGSWRRSIGYVPQEMLLFNETVLLNLTLGDPSLTRDDAMRALKMAGAFDFVMAKDGGLDHPIGDRGGMLSGGQRQRIAIARALMGSPSLLVLDEVTAALDPATESEICDTLRELAGTVTILAISHQTAMREAADLVYEMRGGKLEEVHGTEDWLSLARGRSRIVGA